jgi:hypothetical protein
MDDKKSRTPEKDTVLSSKKTTASEHSESEAPK